VNCAKKKLAETRSRECENQTPSEGTKDENRNEVVNERMDCKEKTPIHSGVGGLKA